MRLLRTGDSEKGWFVGPWNSDLDVSIGYANEGIGVTREELGL